MLGVKSLTLKTANEENCIPQLETNSLYLREEFRDMTYWPTDSDRYSVLHLDDGSSFLVMGGDLTNLPSNIPQIAEQHTGQLSHLLTYSGSQASSSRPPLFGNARRKGGVLAKIIPAEITHKNVKGPPTFQELVENIFWKKPLM